jgi:hypothetical protein
MLNKKIGKLNLKRQKFIFLSIVAARKAPVM